MATPTTCLPWWHQRFAPVAAAPQVTIGSGCSTNASGNIPCSPESMRANAEQRLQQAGYLSSLSLDAYTLARYMQGEVGNGTIEERVAVGEAAVNRARREGTSINGLLLYRQPAGHPNRGFYGPIHGVGTGVSTAPYGRWATTAADPTLLTVLLANLVITGESADFANGADDQDGPEAWISQGQAALNNYVARLASQGKYWVGPLPGVDHWRTFLQITPGVSASSPAGQALMQRGMEALALPARRPWWPSDLPFCPRQASTNGLTLAVLGGIFLGMLGFTRGWFRRAAERVG